MSEPDLKASVSRRYFTLEVAEWLPDERYRELAQCTVDRRSHWDPERKVKTFYVALSRIRDAEIALGKRMRFERKVAAEIEGEVQPRPKQHMDVCVDVQQKLLVVLVDGEAHAVPFEYVDEVWRILKDEKKDAVQPRVVMGRLAAKLGFSGYKEFYGARGAYYQHYYWPLVCLKSKSLYLVDQSGNGPISFTQEGAACEDWKATLSEPLQSMRERLK